MLTVITLLKVLPSPNGEQHGERPFWREHGPRYLHAWLQSVDQFVPKPHEIVVMTDHLRMVLDVAKAAIGRNVTIAPLNADVDAPGFWAKVGMFAVGKGKTLYCDLDNVIRGPLDELCALEPDPLIMLDDRRVPGLPNGSAILFDAERCRDIWTDYTNDQRTIENSHVPQGDDYSLAYDQAFIASCCEDYLNPVRFFQDLLPEGYILNARSELPNASDWQSARLIFGGGAEGKPHLNPHPGFSLRA